MKAFLLAAGLGTRLRPLTDSVPKCLVQVDGTPLLDLWMEALAAAGVTEVLVNLHHLPEQVERHLARRPQPLAVRTVFEPTLLGSAGTLLHNREFVAGEELFLAVNADNLTDFDLRLLVEAQRSGSALATLALFRAPDPTRCGVVEVRDGVVASFEEKPQHPRGDLANAGLYAFSPDVIDLVRQPLPRDLGGDLLPLLVGRAHALSIGDAYFIDIGTPDALARAEREWARLRRGTLTDAGGRRARG
ncbi:nucleotidyltransferase family protein [Intrasporangium sp. YIM S08009]|uniref:nucleotidyltransferase family protein n=1 Tax=Intrasporangium zincisolvens TaxID=3080018 RepID=UPI002B05F566|nr:nucleotidyltransferase family protein [Intrasporangium sp. YIM S08009]